MRTKDLTPKEQIKIIDNWLIQNNYGKVQPIAVDDAIKRKLHGTLLGELSNHNIEGVSFALKEGANVNSLDSFKQSPIYDAIIYGPQELLNYLVINGANVNNQDKDGKTPLMIAIDQRNKFARDYTVTYLIENGALLNLKTKCGETALFWSVDKGFLGTTKDLIRMGADVNIRNNNGEAVIDIAINKGYTIIA